MKQSAAYDEIAGYLYRCRPNTRKQGEICFRAQKVSNLTVSGLEVEALVDPEIPRPGVGSYEVYCEFLPSAGFWYSACSCGRSRDCAHAYAVMKTLQARGASYLNTQEGGVKRNNGGANKVVRFPGCPQPPASEIYNALTQALNRQLNAQEANFVQQIQWYFREAARGQPSRVEQLRVFAPALQEYSWTPVEFWPEPPRNDLELWLYFAWELRRRKLRIPTELQPVTDFSSIESKMLAWERQKAIVTWKAQLTKSEQIVPSEPQRVDMRLMILPTEARVQANSGTEFKDLKQTALRRLEEQFRAGNLDLDPAAMPLWLALYRQNDYCTMCNLDYDDADTAKLLSRILRMPQLKDRLVTADGTPLEHPTEPLRYQLHPAQDDSDDYVVGLVQSNGADAPPVLLAVPGRPSLYLTERALFEGPPPHPHGMREKLRIPAPAVESLEGVNFLKQLQLELPERLAQRTIQIAAEVTINCELKPTYPGSEQQVAFIRITAKAKSMESEHFGGWGWAPINPKYDLLARKPQTTTAGRIPVIDRSAQQHFPRLLEGLNANWDDYSARWRVRVTKGFPDLFVPWLESIPPSIDVQLDPELATLRDGSVSGTLKLDIQEAGVDWFDLKVALEVSEMSLTQDELKLLLNARGRFVKLGDKGWRRLKYDLTAEDDERLARLGLNARDFTAEPQRLHALQLADEAARKFLPEQQAETIQRRAAELKARVTPPVPEEIHAQLRPYQVEGFHFLAYLTANRFGGVLADDMGLGKTLQTLTWLGWLRRGGDGANPAGSISEVAPKNGSPKGSPDASAETPEVGTLTEIPPGAVATDSNKPGKATLPSLVVCPKSVMDNWVSEAARFCPGLRVRLWRGDDATALNEARNSADLIVINYAQLRSLSPDISQHPWHVAILDEAQYIKNPNSQTAQIARTLRADHRLALTGTPIENRLLDLWSIFAFAMPGVLGNRAQFARTYGQQGDAFARRRLAARVRPFLLRRTKGQVAQDLPDRVEEDLACEMDGEQKNLYRAELKRAQQMLLKVQTQQELNEHRFHFLTSLLRLRQICCHPALISDDLQKAESAKVNALLDVLEPLMEGGHKVLVFSQFVSMLEILREMIEKRGWSHFYLAGETENRGELVSKFQAATSSAVFLISLKAGGFGLNLTAASYVVLFDPWWNPAVEMQAIDRTHRIGQTSKVIAYRLLVKDSIEEKIRQLQRSKAALAEDVLGEEKFAQALTLDDLRFLFAGE